MHTPDLMRPGTMRRGGGAILIVALLLAAATFSPVSAESYRPGPIAQVAVEPFAWPESAPEQQELDSSALAAAMQEAATRSYMYGLVVIRYGYLVAEGYFNGQTRYDANHIHSASKSFTSTLVGIAFDRGYLDDLDQRILDFFPEYVTANMDPRKHDITIRHLLMMKAGFDWDDTEANWIAYASSPDWVRYALELPLRHDPGERFNYSTVQTNLLSVILTRATGMSTREFAETYLFGPLQITIGRWSRDPQGYYTGGHEMYFAPRDMARLGYLFLRHGSVDGQEIVPAEWVEESTQRYASVPGGPVLDRGYGYQWWLGRLAGYPIFYAHGKGGQSIVSFPDLDMIVVTTTNGDPWGSQITVQANETMRLIADYVVPAVLTEGYDLLRPNRLATTILSPTTALVTWHDRSADEDAFEVHVVRGEAGPWQEAAVVGADREWAVLRRLTPETTYRVRVRARDGAAVSEWCPEETFTLPARLPRPDRVAATMLSASRVRLSWRDHSAGEDTFEVGLRRIPGRWQDAAVVAAGVRSLVLAGLTPETTYGFRVRARGSGGLSEWSSQPRVTLPAELARPDELEATVLTSTRVLLEWRDRSAGEDVFEVGLSSGGGPWEDAATVGPGVERLVLSWLTPATVYRFRVRARSSTGLSEWSRPVTVTLPAVPAAP